MKHYPLRFFTSLPALLCLLLVGWSVASAQAEERAIPPAFDWDRKVDLDVRGAPLGELISQLNIQAGVSLRPSKELCGQAQEIWKEPLWLQGRGLTLRQSMMWITRMLGCRYRYEGGNPAEGYKIVLDNGYGWVGRHDTGIILRNIEMLMGGRFDVEALDRQLAEIFKIITLFDANFYVRLEEHGKQVKLVAALPEDLKPLFDQALGMLEQQGMSVPPQIAQPVGEAELDLITRLSRSVMIAYRQRPLNEVAADLATQGGINIGYDQTPFRGGKLPVITLELGKTTLREAVEKLAKAAGLPGIELSLPGGIWLGKRPTRWSRMGDREIAWRDTVAVRAYYIGNFKEGLDGELLAHQIRTRISPESWLDPLVSISYHPPSGNLLVIAGEPLLHEVEQALARYRQQGLSDGETQPPALPGPSVLPGASEVLPSARGGTR